MDIGIWTDIIELEERGKDGHKLYRGVCRYCGKITVSKKRDLGRASICRHQKNFIKNRRLAGIFRKMVDRCYKETDISYRSYGGKGICVCDKWLNDPLLFEEWALSNGYEDNLTIDRIDPFKNYCPENCRWITKEENLRWKSTTRHIDVNGVVHSGREWASILNLNINVINKYINKYGEKLTQTFIAYCLKNGIPERHDRSESYMDAMLNK